jgi:hypothetical protein
LGLLPPLTTAVAQQTVPDGHWSVPVFPVQFRGLVPPEHPDAHAEAHVVALVQQALPVGHSTQPPSSSPPHSGAEQFEQVPHSPLLQ